MGLALVIGPGEREWFRGCRRAWDFSSPNRRNLVPQAAPDRSLAGAVRMAMAVWYFPGMWEWPRSIVQPRAMQAFEEAAAKNQADKEEVESAQAMLERYFAWAPTADSFAPVRVEADFEAGIPDTRTPGLELVDADGRPVRYHDRIHVLVVDARDAYWVMEHRLAMDGWAGRDELLLAERPVAAAWGWEQFYLMEFAGTIHNELRLRGGPAGPDDDEPDDSGGWFRRTWIRRSRAEIGSVGERLSAEVADMLDPALRLYPTPAPELCGRCDYRAPCLAMNEGADAEAILAGSYRLREEVGPEEGRLGGGSWSMNRGAAPPPQWRSPRKPPS
jgi:hypothetical protein